MITINNFKSLITSSLGFEQVDGTQVYSKKYDSISCELQVDFARELLIYPKDKGFKVEAATTCNFSAPENFVVFECVCRLFEKGYRPEHIELERTWHLGHNQKSGRADICISTPDGQNTLAIIECKTAGTEYNKAVKDTKSDGGQLFSYWQQERSTQWIVLYTSDYANSQLTYKELTINCSDDSNILAQSKRDKDVKTYEKAMSVVEKYETWRDTYNCASFDNIVFSTDTVAYNIGMRPIRKQDLRDFEPDDKIVNRFEEILRHNNVSDKENAFNRLIALFICKLVDEIKKQDFEEVEFQYKQGTDTYEDLQDRLQRLHKEGMEEFMREDIYYVPNDYAEKLFTTFTGQKRKEAIKNLSETIRTLKFYTNNDFAFKDVHNEELFYQNGKIVVEMVQLFESYRIVYPQKHQFLGDLFEQLLNKGFKQNEGQFFTPTPITRFIWDSLPVNNYISKHGLPKIIDYACGAGHFLTEAVEAINILRGADLQDKGVNDWVREHIVGIEKDYRLARVSKISLFMNGAGEGNIIFGDGLENYPDKNIKKGSFDILVANPPYAVSSFKPHLRLKNNSFRLLDFISNDGSEIETLFVERISQLIKPEGLVAVVLPSSILSNTSSSYIAAREELLENFKIRAIVCFGSQTFGATGTNTVTLFMEKYSEPPRYADLQKDIVEGIINHDASSEWEDADLLNSYTATQGVECSLYKSFVNEDLTFDDICTNDYLRQYFDAFQSKTIKVPKKLSDEEEKKYKMDKFYDFALDIERQKLYYYCLTARQRTLVISSPDDNKAQKQFLGYSWSNRKGNEGIKIDRLGGYLYNDMDRSARGTLACAIRNTFADADTILNEDLQQYAKTYNLCNLLDFSRPSFDKNIRTKAVKIITVESNYKLVELGTIALIRKGTSITSAKCIEGNIKVVSGGKDFMCFHNEANRPANVITVSASGANAGYVNIWKEPIFASDCSTIESNSTEARIEYIYAYLQLKQSEVFGLQKGAGQPHVYPEDLEKIQIPLPPIKVQQKIIYECKLVDDEYTSTRMEIETYKQRIAEIFRNLEVIASKFGGVKLSDIQLFTLSIGKRVLAKDINETGQYPVYSANVFEPFGYTDKLLITDFSQPSVIWGIDGDWQVNMIPQNTPFYPTDHCGVMRISSNQIHPRYMAWALEKAGRSLNFSRSYRASLDRIESITINIPPQEEQWEAMIEVEGLEQRIQELESSLYGFSLKKRAIVSKYL